MRSRAPNARAALARSARRHAPCEPWPARLATRQNGTPPRHPHTRHVRQSRASVPLGGVRLSLPTSLPRPRAESTPIRTSTFQHKPEDDPRQNADASRGGRANRPMRLASVRRTPRKLPRVSRPSFSTMRWRYTMTLGPALDRTLDGKLPATFQAPRAQHLTPRPRAHPSHKPVFAHTASALGLPRPLHTVPNSTFPPNIPPDYTVPHEACQMRCAVAPLNAWGRN